MNNNFFKIYSFHFTTTLIVLLMPPFQCSHLFIIVSFGTPKDSNNPVQILLSYNFQLTKLNEKAFKPVLDYFECRNYGFIGLRIDLAQCNIQHIRF